MPVEIQAGGAVKARPKFVLGTVQLGMAYGAANAAGMPSHDEAVALVEAALGAGVGALDTARDYGLAEERIGAALRNVEPRPHVTTKLDPLRDLSPAAPAGEAIARAAASLAASRAALGREHLDAVLLHRAPQRTAWGGAAWRLLREERDAGRIGRIGVSVQSPEEAHAAIADADVGQVQLPFNLLDHRWEASGVIDALCTRPEIVVHARSVLLQGLLAGGVHVRWPRIGGVEPETLIARLAQVARELGRRDAVDLAIAFVRSQDWIDGLVIGLETQAQLDENSALFGTAALSAGEVEDVRRAMPELPAAFLDPAQWPTPAPLETPVGITR